MDFSKLRVKNSQVDIEPHEVFLDDLAKTKELDLGITQKKLEVPIGEGIVYLIFGLFALIVVIFSVKVFSLQVLKGSALALASENNRVRPQYERAERGVIYDQNLKQLVFNNSSFDLVCDKRDLAVLSNNIVAEIEQVANILEQSPEDLRNIIEQERDSEVLVAEDLPHQTLVALEARIKDLPGFKIESNTMREYKNGSFYSHIIGYMSKISKSEIKAGDNYSVADYVGKSGAEKSFESVLRGNPGVIKIGRDSLGQVKGGTVESEPLAGKSVVLYLDSELQRKLVDVLQERLGDLGLRKAAAVAVDPRTGGILAMVSLPSFDNNALGSAISAEELGKIQNDSAKPFLNRVISGQYPTGSSIKPFTAAAALQEGIITADKQIWDPGYIEVKSQYDPSVVYRYGGLEAPGYYDVRTAIAQSSNIYFYTIGGGYKDQQGLGPAKIKEYLELFGWGKKTNIDLVGEVQGFIPSPEWKKQTFKENWWDGDTYHLSIGQGALTATPLQVAMAYAAIANGGTLYQPEIVKKIVDTSSGVVKTVEQTKPVVIRDNFIDQENLQAVREGMKLGASAGGTGRVLTSLPVQAASKTGTAQTGRDEVYEIWANVFAPYDNPEISLTIIVEDVEGLKVPALMVARDVLQWYFAR